MNVGSENVSAIDFVRVLEQVELPEREEWSFPLTTEFLADRDDGRQGKIQKLLLEDNVSDTIQIS